MYDTWTRSDGVERYEILNKVKMRKGVLDPAGIGRENMVNHLQNKTYLSSTMASIIYWNKTIPLWIYYSKG
jgi:hypothetical protein